MIYAILKIYILGFFCFMKAISPTQVEHEYNGKILSKTKQLKKRYEEKKKKDRSKINTYRTERYKRDLEKRTKKYTEDKEKKLRNLQRAEK